jgi:hypothetical protein
MATVEQMYRDIEKVTKNRGGDFVSEAVLSVFNANLTEAKKAHAENAIIGALQPARGQVRNAEFLLLVGQLKAAMDEEQPPISSGFV